MSKDKNPDFESFTVDYINVIRYTRDAWDKFFPEDSEEWKYVSNPNSVLDFIDVQQKLMEDNLGYANEDIPIKIVTIDDEYFDWLGDREDSTSTRLEYCDSIDAEKAMELAEKYDMQYSYTACFFPLILLPDDLENAKKRLTRKTQEEFEKYIKTITPDLDVFVAPFLVDFRKIEDSEDEIIEIAKMEFEGSKAPVPEKFKRVDIGDEPFVVCGIPIVFKEVHDTMIFVPNEIYSDDMIRIRALNNITMSEDFFEAFDIDEIKPFVESHLPKMIHDDFEMNEESNSFFDFWVAVWDIPGFVEEISAALHEEAERQEKEARKKRKKRKGLFGLNRNIPVEEDDEDDGGIA